MWGVSRCLTTQWLSLRPTSRVSMEPDDATARRLITISLSPTPTHTHTSISSPTRAYLRAHAGNLEYFSEIMSRSKVVHFDTDADCYRLTDNGYFVHGGDSCDKGNGVFACTSLGPSFQTAVKPGRFPMIIRKHFVCCIASRGH